MSKNLSARDGQAVDLVLDRVQRVSAEGNFAFTPSNGVAAQSIEATRRVLSLLQMLPAQDPPADLAARTMARIDEAVAFPGEAPAPLMTLLNSQQGIA